MSHEQVSRMAHSRRSNSTALLLTAFLALASLEPVEARQSQVGRLQARPLTTAPAQGTNAFAKLNLDEKGHSYTNAYLLSLVSHYMYLQAHNPLPRTTKSFERQAGDLFKSWGMDTVELREEGSVQFVVMSNQSTVIVAFRGSDAMDSEDAVGDWVLINGLALQRKTGLWGIETNLRRSPGVHSGIYNAYCSVRNDINERIGDQIRAKDGSLKALFLTGHSLGGSLAILCAIDQGYAIDRLENRRFVAQGVYTFGAPRVGNGIFASLYESKLSAGGAKALNTHRYVNGNDLVPMLPGDSLIDDGLWVPLPLYGLGEPHENVRYQHVGRTCNIKLDGRIVRDDKEHRGIGWIDTHHSKLYAHRIFERYFTGEDSASKLPPKPGYPIIS